MKLKLNGTILEVYETENVLMSNWTLQGENSASVSSHYELQDVLKYEIDITPILPQLKELLK